jgi:hypothetical protein
VLCACIAWYKTARSHLELPRLHKLLLQMFFSCISSSLGTAPRLPGLDCLPQSNLFFPTFQLPDPFSLTATTTSGSPPCGGIRCGLHLTSQYLADGTDTARTVEPERLRRLLFAIELWCCRLRCEDGSSRFTIFARIETWRVPTGYW